MKFIDELPFIIFKIVMTSAVLFLIAAIPYMIYEDSKCSNMGGKPTRIGCVKPEIFMEKR